MEHCPVACMRGVSTEPHASMLIASCETGLEAKPVAGVPAEPQRELCWSVSLVGTRLVITCQDPCPLSGQLSPDIPVVFAHIFRSGRQLSLVTASRRNGKGLQARDAGQSSCKQVAEQRRNRPAEDEAAAKGSRRRALKLGETSGNSSSELIYQATKHLSTHSELSATLPACSRSVCERCLCVQHGPASFALQVQGCSHTQINQSINQSIKAGAVEIERWSAGQRHLTHRRGDVGSLVHSGAKRSNRPFRHPD